MKKLIPLLLILTILTACGTPAGAPADSTETSTQHLTDATTVALCLPNLTEERWQRESAALTALLEQQDLAVQVQDAENDAFLQAEQLAAMVALPADCLIVAAIDPLTLTEALTQAKAANIPVIAYDRLLTNTDGVSAYVAPDSEEMGRSMGQYIISENTLETAQTEGRSYTIEFFMGTPEDHGALLLHRGLMSVLQPYLDNGVLQCLSGRISFEDTCVPDNAEELARADCANCLSTFYAEAPPDILCTAADALANGCRIALEDAGCSAEDAPLITSCGSTDTQTLTAACAELAAAFIKGEADGLTNTTCHNGIVDVPAILCPPCP